MASANLDSAGVKKLLDNLQSDLKNISLETKKRHPAVKESAEEAIVKIRNASSAQTPLAYLSNQILYPLVQGCETKDTKVVTLCLQVIQRLITAQVLKHHNISQQWPPKLTTLCYRCWMARVPNMWWRRCGC